MKKIPLVARPFKEDSRRNKVKCLDRWKNRQRKRVSEFTSVRDERVKKLVNSCNRKMDRIGIRSRKSCAARLQGEGGRACS